MSQGTATFPLRPGLAADVPVLQAVIEHSARELGVGFYTQQQAEAAVPALGCASPNPSTWCLRGPMARMRRDA